MQLHKCMSGYSCGPIKRSGGPIMRIKHSALSLIGFRSSQFGPIKRLTRLTGGPIKRNLLYITELLPAFCLL